MANYPFLKDRSIKIDIANRAGRVVDIDLYQGGIFLRTLIAGLDADTATLNTSDDPNDDNHIPIGSDYRVRITNQADRSEWTVLSPAPFDVFDDYEQAVPSMLWANDEGFEFAACGRCYLESLDSTEDPVDGGETASDLYSNDPVGGVVGRVHSKRPSGNANIPDHRLRQSTSANKPPLKRDDNGRLYWECEDLLKGFVLNLPAPITNLSAFHFIFCMKVNNALGGGDDYLLSLSDGFGLVANVDGNDTVFRKNSLFAGQATFDPDAGDPVLNTTDLAIVEAVIFKDSGTGQSKISINGVSKNFEHYWDDLPAGDLLVSQGNFKMYSCGFRAYEVTGAELDDWRNHHLTQAGGSPL